jgi:hypothetical protein
MLTRLIAAWGGSFGRGEHECAARLLGSICLHFFVEYPLFSAYCH